jgi:hypothetical protein
MRCIGGTPYNYFLAFFLRRTPSALTNNPLACYERWVCLRETIVPHRIDDARQWRARAEEARELAEQLTSPEAKRIMLGIAVSYVALAQMANERDKARDHRRH